MSKKLNAEKYRVLCEKEEMICFMADYAPFAPIRRITGGASKEMYEARLTQSWDKRRARYRRGVRV